MIHAASTERKSKQTFFRILDDEQISDKISFDDSNRIFSPKTSSGSEKENLTSDVEDRPTHVRAHSAQLKMAIKTDRSGPHT